MNLTFVVLLLFSSSFSTAAAAFLLRPTPTWGGGGGTAAAAAKRWQVASAATPAALLACAAPRHVTTTTEQRHVNDEDGRPDEPFAGASSSSSDSSVRLYLGPPPPLDEMKVGEMYVPFDPLQIVKLANDPPIFFLRNFLTAMDCEELIEQVSEQGMDTAETKSGVVRHRVKSSVAWIAPDHSIVADFMTCLSARLFLHDQLLENYSSVHPESVQVVRYDETGKFDLHHDGFNRTVTVLTYLNGVAGTWFPYIGAPVEEMPTMTLENRGMLNGRVPGRDGLCILGATQPNIPKSLDHTVRVNAGDAVVFYNYETEEERDNMFMSWRSIHCGLPATETKWIATNWFRLDEDRELYDSILCYTVSSTL
jgi:2OG-Fe(II) oxygenase superfamily